MSVEITFLKAKISTDFWCIQFKTGRKNMGGKCFFLCGCKKHACTLLVWHVTCYNLLHCHWPVNHEKCPVYFSQSRTFCPIEFWNVPPVFHLALDNLSCWILKGPRIHFSWSRTFHPIDLWKVSFILPGPGHWSVGKKVQMHHWSCVRVALSLAYVRCPGTATCCIWHWRRGPAVRPAWARKGLRPHPSPCHPMAPQHPAAQPLAPPASAKRTRWTLFLPSRMARFTETGMSSCECVLSLALVCVFLLQ